MNLSEKLRNSNISKNTVHRKNISIESEMSKKKIEDVCVSMDDLHEIESFFREWNGIFLQFFRGIGTGRD